MAEAPGRVVVDDVARLHPRVDDDGAYELESSLPQRFGYLLRKWGAADTWPAF